MSYEKLNMQEIASVERIAGQSVRKLADEDAPISNLLTAIAYMVQKREDPKLNFEAFSKSVTLEEVMKLVTGEEEDEELKK